MHFLIYLTHTHTHTQHLPRPKIKSLGVLLSTLKAQNYYRDLQVGRGTAVKFKFTCSIQIKAYRQQVYPLVRAQKLTNIHAGQ